MSCHTVPSCALPCLSMIWFLAMLMVLVENEQSICSCLWSCWHHLQALSLSSIMYQIVLFSNLCIHIYLTFWPSNFLVFNFHVLCQYIYNNVYHSSKNGRAWPLYFFLIFGWPFTVDLIVVPTVFSTYNFALPLLLPRPTVVHSLCYFYRKPNYY